MEIINIIKLKRKICLAYIVFISINIRHYIIWLFGLVSKPLFYHLSKRGVFVYYWVLNNEKEFDRALRTGCHGIMTDNPTLLKKYLSSHNLYNKQ